MINTVRYGNAVENFKFQSSGVLGFAFFESNRAFLCPHSAGRD
jgi:hypothetical protein